MKKPLRTKPIILLLLVLAAGWFYLYVNSHAVSVEQQNATLNLLRDIKQTDAEWSANVLKSQAEINRNYDPLAKPLDTLAKMLAALEVEIKKQNDPDLQAEAARISYAIDRKILLIDRFKTQDSLLKNSLRYVPTVSKEIQQQLRIQHDKRVGKDARMTSETIALINLESALGILVSEGLQYNAMPDAEATNTLTASINRTYSGLSSYPRTIQESMRHLLAHLEIILHLRLEQENILRSITDIPVAIDVDVLSAHLTERFNQELARQFTYQRVLLVYSAFALILFFGLAGVTTYRLDALVKSRTIALTTEKERAEIANRAIESSFNAIVITDASNANNFIQYVNPAFERMSRYPSREVIGRDLGFLFGKDTLLHSNAEDIQTALKEQREAHVVLQNYRKDGTAFWNEMYIAPVRDGMGNVTHFVFVLNDITETRNYQEQLKLQATYDALTGLPNRMLLLDRLNQAIAIARRENSMLAIVFFDLDRFKWVNDSFGHKAGDELLIAIANRLSCCLRKSDTVARLAGDEFVLILPVGRISPESATIESDSINLPVMEVLTRIIRKISEPLVLGGQEIHISCSMGASIFPHDGEDLETLLKNADAAMYRAKANGRNNFQFYREHPILQKIKDGII